MLCGPGAQGWISGFSSLVWMLGCLVFAKPSYKQAQTTMRADGGLFLVQERLHVLRRQFGQWALAQSRDQVQFAQIRICSVGFGFHSGWRCQVFCVN